MHALQVQAAIGAAMSIASSHGLGADDAVVLHNSNRLAVRLMPCDVMARIAPASYQENAEFEVTVAQRLAETGSPVAALDPRIEPRVHLRDDFAITMWTFYEPESPSAIAPADYAQALERLHAGMRTIDLPVPHFTDRIAEAQSLVGNRDHTPSLADPDREFLGTALRNLRQAIEDRGAAEQLLHGEPHPGNLLSTENGSRFIDFETCCRGPVEFDIAHAPEGVSEHYPGVDRELLGECRMLVLAMVASWRWDRDDQFPNGHQMGIEMLSQLRAAMNLTGLDASY